MTDKILCRYFLHGACRKGENCLFSHDWKSPPSTVCSYYLRGCCSYGSGCRYDHVKDPKAAALRASESQTAASSSESAATPRASRITSTAHACSSQSGGCSAIGCSNGSSSTAKAHRSQSGGPSAIGCSHGSYWTGGDANGYADTIGYGGRGGYNSVSSGPERDGEDLAWGRHRPNVGGGEGAWESSDHERGNRGDASSGWGQASTQQSNRSGYCCYGDDVGGWNIQPKIILKPEDQPLCSFAAAGDCPREGRCPQLHGVLCNFCGKRCLHPYRQHEWEDHTTVCEKREKKLAALRMSQELECSVCLEKVLSKPAVAERKFGILSGCDHTFCIGCIRGWRKGDHTAGLDLATVVRACPVCRVQSHFVTPSVVWYFTPEEKEELVSGYKNKLSEIDCKYFDFGNGTCPFGTSCFYKHAFRDGRKDEVKLRYLGTSDGGVKIASSIRLSDFLQDMTLDDTSRRSRSRR